MDDGLNEGSKSNGDSVSSVVTAWGANVISFDNLDGAYVDCIKFGFTGAWFTKASSNRCSEGIKKGLVHSRWGGPFVS